MNTQIETFPTMPTNRHSQYMRGWSTATTEWLNWMKSGGASKATLSLRLYQLTRVAQELEIGNPWTVTDRDLTAWIAQYDWSQETLRSYRSCLRSFFGWAHATGRIAVDPARLLRKVRPAQARPRPAAERVIAAAMERADDRQWLMLMLGAHHGLRRGEIACIHSDDLVEDIDGWSLLVHGKGNKERVIPLLDEIARVLRERPNGWVFPNGFGTHITPAHVGVLIRRCMDGATAHQLRHRFASSAYAATHDIRAIQELLGHASVATTQRYTAVPDGALRRVLSAAS